MSWLKRILTQDDWEPGEAIGSDTAPINVGGEGYLRMAEGDRLVIEFGGKEWEVVTTDERLEVRIL